MKLHPAKIEVRFTDEKIIADSIYFAVKNAILLDTAPAEITVKQPKGLSCSIGSSPSVFCGIS